MVQGDYTLKFDRLPQILKKINSGYRLGSFSYTFLDLAWDFYMVFVHNQSDNHSATLFRHTYNIFNAALHMINYGQLISI